MRQGPPPPKFGTPEHYVVGPEFADGRLDRFLLKSVPGADRDQVLRWLEGGHATIRGKPCKPLRRLHGGEEVVLIRPPAKATWKAARIIEGLTVLAESPAWVAIDKPAGLATDEQPNNHPSVVTAMAMQMAGWSAAGKAQPGLVHRLDRDTTGCLLLARNDAGLAGLNKAFDEGEVEKRYLAVVRGTPFDLKRLEGPYARDPKDPRRYTTRAPSARRAALSYETLGRAETEHGPLALLSVQLETGRTHQIRVQLSEHNVPLLGDTLYAPMEVRLHPMTPGRVALHAWKLSFPDIGGPANGRVELTAPIPADLHPLVSLLAPELLASAAVVVSTVAPTQAAPAGSISPQPRRQPPRRRAPQSGRPGQGRPGAGKPGAGKPGPGRSGPGSGKPTGQGRPSGPGRPSPRPPSRPKP